VPFVRSVRFKVVVGKTINQNIMLKNTSEYAVAFKVMTTAPKRYSVCPSSSVIKAHESIEVRITMQVRDTCLRDRAGYTDMFLLGSVLAEKSLVRSL